MVMKARDLKIRGTQVNMTNNSYGLTTSVLTNVLAERYILRNVQSSVGPDRKTPRVHSYEKIDMLGLRGMYRDWTPNTQNWTEKSGIVGGTWEAPVTKRQIGADNAYNDALEELQSSMRHNVDLSIDLLQSPQAVKMVRAWSNGAKHLITTLREVKKMPLKAASSAYLQYVYGVAPTMSTIFGAMAAFADSAKGSYKVKGRGRYRDTVRETINVNYVPTQFTYNISQRCEIGCIYTRPTESMAHISNYTSLNPASIVYEMIPFSFVVDWFYDVGGWMRGLESAYVLSPFMSSCYASASTRVELVVQQSYTSVSPSRGVIRTGKAQTKHIVFSRVPKSSLILPRAPVFPKWNLEGVSVNRTLQGLALSRSVAKGLDKSLLLR